MGKVVDKDTNEPISFVFVQIRNQDGELIAATSSDGEGVFSFLMACASETFITETFKEGYEINNSSFKTTMVDAEVKLNLELTKVDDFYSELGKESKDKDLTKLLNLEPLYFELNKSNITPQAEEQLKKIIDYMNEYKRLKVDVRSHTDSRGSDAYNLAL